jgi:hypothetical protein
MPPGLYDRLIGLGQGALHGLSRIVRGGQPILNHSRDNLGCKTAGPLAVVLTAHSVRHQVQLVAVVGHEAIFVIRPDTLGATGTDSDDEFRHEECAPPEDALEEARIDEFRPSKISTILTTFYLRFQHRTRRRALQTARILAVGTADHSLLFKSGYMGP